MVFVGAEGDGDASCRTRSKTFLYIASLFKLITLAQFALHAAFAHVRLFCQRCP